MKNIKIHLLLCFLVSGIFIAQTAIAQTANRQVAPQEDQNNNQSVSQKDISDLYTFIMNREGELSDKMLSYTSQSLQHSKDTINYFLIVLGIITTFAALFGWKTVRDVKKNARLKIEEIAKREMTKFTDRLENRINKLDEKVEENIKNSLLWSKFKESKDLNEKYSIIEKLIKENPDDAFLYYKKGSILIELKKYDEAICAIDKAIEIKPSESLAFHLKSMCLIELKKYDEAICAIDKAIEIKRKSEYIEFKGVIYLELKQYENAIKFYEEARNVELDESDGKCDDYAGYLINISFCYHKLKNFAKAYDKARIGLSFGFRLELLVNKGLAAAGLGMRKEALESLDLALETGVRKAEVVYCYARAFSLLKDYDNTFKYLRMAVNEDKKIAEMAKEEDDFNFISNTEEFRNTLLLVKISPDPFPSRDTQFDI